MIKYVLYCEFVMCKLCVSNDGLHKVLMCALYGSY